MSLLDTLPPQALDLESCVLGSMLIDPHAARAASYLLAADDFYKGANQKIFTVAVELLSRAEHFDLPLLVSELESKSLLEEVGGAPYLAGMAESVGTSAHIESYCAIVRRQSRARKAIAIATELVRRGFSPGIDPDELAAEAVDRLLGLLASAEGGMVGIDEPAKRLYDLLDRQVAPKGEATGIHTIDRLANGLHPRDYMVIGARPSTGKTTLGLRIALNMAARGLPVVFFSLEMYRDELVAQALRLETGVDALRRMPSGDDRVRGMEGAMDLARLPIRLMDSAAGGRDMRVSDIMAMTRALAADGKCSVAFVDYMGLVEGPEAENRQQQVTLISKGFKNLAKRSGVSVVVLCQLNREPDKTAARKTRRRPQLSDFRESGSIEQDADLAVLLWRPNMFRPDSEGGDDGEFHIALAKNRYGPIGADQYWFGKDGSLVLAALSDPPPDLDAKPGANYDPAQDGCSEGAKSAAQGELFGGGAT